MFRRLEFMRAGYAGDQLFSFQLVDSQSGSVVVPEIELVDALRFHKELSDLTVMVMADMHRRLADRQKTIDGALGALKTNAFDAIADQLVKGLKGGTKAHRR